MAIQFPKHFTQDLTQDLKIRQCGTIVFNTDNLSNVVSVDLYNGDTPATPAGTVVGAVICSDGSTVPIDNGTISGNTVSITLTAACFAITGQIGVGIQLVDNGVKTTVLKAIYNVERFETDNVIDPDSRITMSVSDLVDDIAAAIATIPADYSDLMAAVAPTFSTSTAYAAGVYVWYDGVLYQFTTAHAAGSWTGTDAVAATISSNLATLRGDILTTGDSTQIIRADDPRMTKIAGAYIRNPTQSSTPGKIYSYSNNDTYWLQASQNCTVYIDIATDTSSACLRVSNEQPIVGSGSGTEWTGSLYSNKQPSGTEPNLPTAENPASVTAGQYIAVWNVNSSWTLYINETAVDVLKPAFGLTAQMREEVKAMLAEVQALTLEN